MPPMIGVSAYRIVQEALTNTLKHAAASRADVRVGLCPTSSRSDHRRRPAARRRYQGRAPGGLGLIGMRGACRAARRPAHGGAGSPRRVAARVKLPTSDDAAVQHPRGGWPMTRRWFAPAVPDDPRVRSRDRGCRRGGERASRPRPRPRPDIALMDFQMPTVTDSRPRGGLPKTASCTARVVDPHHVSVTSSVRGPAVGRQRLPAQERPTRGAPARGARRDGR